MELKNISMSTGTGKGKNIPEGATILKEEKNIRVEEIDNGFLVITDYETQYETVQGGVDWAYHSTKVYSKTNPVKIEIKKEKSLADKID